jgi:trypsin
MRVHRRHRALVGLLAAVCAAAPAVVAPAGPAGAVVGGQEADLAEWPWQVALLVDGTIWCGGSLVDAAIVLTAAHCTDGVPPTEIEVVAGTIDLRSGGERRRVARIDQHAEYDDVALVNDISLLILDRPFPLGETIAPAELATPEESAARSEEGDPAVVTGFGAVEESGPPSDLLLEAEIDTFADERCEELYRQDGDSVVGDSQVCAGRERGHVDACYGDSGGPLVVPLGDEGDDVDEWRQIGIVSWGAGCAAPERPTIYTEVSAFTDWLGERGVGPGAGERFEGDGARIPARGTVGKAGRYPLSIEVPTFPGVLESASVRLVGLSHERPEDLDVWLVAPDGTVVTLLSDVGGSGELDSVDLLVVDGAGEAGDAELGSQLGPSDLEGDDQRKGARSGTELAALRGIDPVGTWQLLVADDRRGSSGRLEGWTLQLR